MATIIATARDGSRHEVEADTGISMMESLRDWQDGVLEVAAVCGGCCSCATCHVLVAPDWAAKLFERSEDELALLEESGHFDEATSRLSCQVIMTDALDGIAVTIAPED